MIDGFDLSFIAASDLSAKQYSFVKFTAAEGNVDICSGVTDIAIGVLQNDPKAGQAAVVRFFGKTKVLNGAGAVAVGNVLGTDADGEAAVYAAGTDTTKYLMGVATKAATNDDEVVEMYLKPIARGA